MEDDYFSLESILADNHVRQASTFEERGTDAELNGQKLSCTFTLDVPGLGYLEGGTENDVRYTSSSPRCLRDGFDQTQIHQHQKLELPFWLAQTLSLKYLFLPSPPPPFCHCLTRTASSRRSRFLRLTRPESARP